MIPEPWEPGYKPPTAREAFAKDTPLPRSALDTLDYINRKDAALQAAEARVATLEAMLRVVANNPASPRAQHLLAQWRTPRVNGVELPEVFERRGPDICISVEWPSGRAVWVNYARFIATKRYVKVGRHILRWDEFEVVMHRA